MFPLRRVSESSSSKSFYLDVFLNFLGPLEVPLCSKKPNPLLANKPLFNIILVPILSLFLVVSALNLDEKRVKFTSFDSIALIGDLSNFQEKSSDFDRKDSFKDELQGRMEA